MVKKYSDSTRLDHQVFCQGSCTWDFGVIGLPDLFHLLRTCWKIIIWALNFYVWFHPTSKFFFIVECWDKYLFICFWHLGSWRKRSWPLALCHKIIWLFLHMNKSNKSTFKMWKFHCVLTTERKIIFHHCIFGPLNPLLPHVVYRCTLQTYIILLANVIPIHLIKKRKSPFICFSQGRMQGHFGIKKNSLSKAVSFYLFIYIFLF